MALRKSNSGINNVTAPFQYETSVSPNKVSKNHGWKLHADFARNNPLQEALIDVGLNLDNQMQIGMINQEKFDHFSRRVNSLLGQDVKKMSQKELTEFMGVFIGLNDLAPGDDLNQVLSANINRQLDFFEALDNQGIDFKSSVSRYGRGREVTIYAGAIEERDRAISFVESNFGDLLEDAPDPYQTRPSSWIPVKNNRISQKTTGRFTTDYLPVGYQDLTEDGSTANRGLGVMKDARDSMGNTRISPDDIPMAQTGEIIPGTLDELEEMARRHPELGEALRGRVGYVSPYNTIEDIYEHARRAEGWSPSIPSTVQARVRETSVDPTPVQGNVNTPPQTRQRTPRSVGRTVQSFDNTPATQEPVRTPRSNTTRATISGTRPSTTTRSGGSTRPTVSGNSSRTTQRGMQLSSRASSAVASGAKGSRNLRIAAATAAVGLGAYGVNRVRGRSRNEEYRRNQ